MIRICALAIVVFLILIFAVYGIGRKLETTSADVQAEIDMSIRGETLNYAGKNYRYNKHLLTILLMGIDKSSQDSSEAVISRKGGQSDFIMLLIVDPREKTITQLHIDRDTMADVTTIGPMGNATGTRKLQLCLSHAFGDGGEQSCELTRDAVENLLPGIDINFYAALNMDAIPALNDAVGGVTVHLQDDFSAIDTAMQQGEDIKLSGSQAETFVRHRMTVGDGSNHARMQRQRLYLSGFADALDDALSQNRDAIGGIYDLLGDALTTDMGRGRMINEVNSALDYEREDKLTLPGRYTEDEDGFIEFHADTQALEALVMEIFYIPVD